jgi:hypothetical protein
MYGNDVPSTSGVSASYMASLDGEVPIRPIPPVVYGLTSGITALPKSALTIGAPSFSAPASTSSPASSAPYPTSITILFPILRV